MYQVKQTCRFCGKEMMVFAGTKERRYCSISCANRARSLPENDEYDHELKWERTGERQWQCPYEENVSCTFRRCATCGWNPQVAKMRSEKRGAASEK